MASKRFGTGRFSPAWVVLTLALILFGTATTAVSQEVTGEIYGKVSDDQGLAIPGATVTLTSPQLMGTETRTTSELGNYRTANLPAGTYAVVAELSGFQKVTVEQVVVRAGQSIAVNVTLSPAGVEETITVTGESPLVDVKNVQTMRTLDTELLDNIPLGRQYADLIVAAPGVLDSEYGFTPAQTVHGSSPRDNLFNVDGASTNDTTVGYISTEIPIDMIDEVQVTTGGVAAEFGLATGGVFNFVTKSGGNEFHGTASYYYQGEKTQWNNLTPELEAQIPAGSETEKNQELGGTLGGPIKRDKIWFFGNVRRPTVAVRQPYLPSTAFTTNQWHGFIKGTAQVHDNTRVNASLTTRDQDQFPANVRDFGNADAPETWEIGYRKQRIVNVNLTQVLTENTLFETRFNRTFKHFLSEQPNNPNFDIGYNDLGTGKQFGGLTAAVSETFKRDMGQFHLSLSHFRENWGGSHEFKTGFYMERSPFDDLDQYPNGENVEQRLRDGAAYRVRLRLLPVHSQTSMNRYAAFFQDQWTLNNRLTLNYGIRWETTEGWFPEQTAGPGQFFPEVVLPEKRDVINLGYLSPRVGVVFALDEDQRTSVKASYGRYYGSLLNQHLLYVNTIGGYEEYQWNDLNGDLVFQNGEQGILTGTSGMPAVARGAPLRQVNPDLKQQYLDNFQVAFERQIGRNFVISVAGIFKREGDIFEDVNIGRPFSAYNPVEVTNPVDNQPITIFVLDPSFLGSPSVNMLTNPQDPVPLYRDYNALEIVAQRRFSDGWQFMASFNWSKSYGNIGNSYGSTSGGRPIYNDPNSLINAEGPLDMDVPYALKLQGTYVTPGDVWLSAYYQGNSGFPLKVPSDFPSDPALGAYTVRFFDTDVPEMVVESYVEIAGVQRGTYRHDFRHMMSIRAEKRFSLGGNKKIGIIADLFNLFNSSRVTTVQSLRYDLPQFLVPARIELPRIFRIGLRFEF